MTYQLSINFEPASFVRSRARRNDCDTSKDAAKHAVSGKADSERKTITRLIKQNPGGLTAREVAACSGIEYISVQRRIAECGLTKTEARRGGCAVWVSA